MTVNTFQTANANMTDALLMFLKTAIINNASKALIPGVGKIATNDPKANPQAIALSECLVSSTLKKCLFSLCFVL